MTDKPKIERFEASNGAQVFRLPMEVFPGYIAFAHLVACEGSLTLVDVGSGFGDSHADLLAGFEAVREDHGLPARLEDVDRIVITHGHVDHFGGLPQVKEIATKAQISLHELARPVLCNYDERVLVASKRVAVFLQQAGVPKERRGHLLDMYMFGKQPFVPMPVNLTLKDGDLLDGGFRVVHVPGHTPGLVMIQIADILLTADHILPTTSVALAPESIMPYTGVGHYIESLVKAGQVEGVRIALGGHEEPMRDYYAVTQRAHDQALEKIDRVLVHCDEPRTIYEIACRIYNNMDGYGELLKLEQTGARVEYLNQRGLITVDNLDALENKADLPLRYRQV